MCQCDCGFTSPGRLSDGRERVQYAMHFLGSMHMMFFDELTWLSLQGNCVSLIGTQVQQSNHIEINTCISRFSLNFFGKKFPLYQAGKDSSTGRIEIDSNVCQFFCKNPS
jgi:hypothetical protein